MVIKDVNIKNYYENEKYQVILTPNNSISLEYLYDNYYCETNNDCVIKDYVCNYGPFNKYERIRTSYGCEGNRYDYQLDYYFGPYDEIMKCNSEVKYQYTKCIDNKCTGLNRTIKCIGQLEIHP